jgi:MscS family membrane protein
LMPLVAKSESDLDDQLMPLIRRLFKVILWAMGIIIGLNNAGFDVAALIAGLGIGGLALALAAQDTVKNIFGGIMVYIDKPFKLKDRIKINGHDGFVEEVGIRSTRMRTLEGRVITLPNAKFSENAVENVSAEPTRKVITNLGLTYETQPAKMQEAINLLKEIASNNPGVDEGTIVSFNSWGDFSMGILFIYFIKPEADILGVQTERNMEILTQFNEPGLEFAYPTQTIYRK